MHRTLQIITRGYLLHLVGCIIFVNKSMTSINMSYLPLLWWVHMGRCHTHLDVWPVGRCLLCVDKTIKLYHVVAS